MFDVMDFYGEPVYLCTHVSVYKYVGIILYGSQYLSFTACKRMLIFLGKKKKVLWELSGKVDSHKQANLRHLLWEALESLFTVLQISAAHHNLLGCFLYCLFSAKWENLLCFLGMLLWLSSGTVKGTRRCAVKLGLSVPIRPLWVFVKTTPQKAPSSESVTSS